MTCGQKTDSTAQPPGGTGELTRGLATLPQRWIQEPLVVRDRDGNPKRTLWQCSASVCVLRHRWCRSPVVSVIPVRPKTVHTSRVQQIFHHSLGVWRPSKLSVVANFICSLHCRLDLIDRKPWTVTTPPHLYADDTQVYGSRPPAAVDALSVKISDCIHDVANWTKSNRLQLNPDKTEAMWTSRRIHPPYWLWELHSSRRSAFVTWAST